MDMINAIHDAERNVDRLAEPQELRSAANQVVAFARARGATALLAASPSAERLLGATLVCADDLTGFPTESELLTGAPVLLLDVNLASGTALAHACRRARAAGAGQVIALVLHQLMSQSATAMDCDLDELTVLD